MTRAEPLVLGIETSCDETGIGIVRGRTLLSNTIASSMDEHARYGGVVPEVAARAHLEALQPTIEAAVAEAGIALDELDAVAVTSGPGLAGARLPGSGARPRRTRARAPRCSPPGPACRSSRCRTAAARACSAWIVRGVLSAGSRPARISCWVWA